MATKKDLIEAQGFSRRRLLTAFTSGAPAGKELEPANPLRAVVAGIVLTAMVVLGGVFYGLIRPGLPDGWENNSLILVEDTGARYVAVGGTLYPVLNTASARLLMPAGEYRVISTDAGTLAEIPIGSTVGILGAPDDLPPRASLIDDGWMACAVPGGTSVTLPAASVGDTVDEAAVVRRGDDTFVVLGDRRFQVAGDAVDPVLRAVGLDANGAAAAEGSWLNLFQPGADLAPLVIEGAGDPVPGTDLLVGTVVHFTGTADDQRFVITADGALADLSPLAYQLYGLGTGADLGGAVDVDQSDIADLPNAADPAGGADWPTEIMTRLSADDTPCAVLGHDPGGAERTLLGTPDAGTVLPPAGEPEIAVGSGSLVRAGGAGTETSGTVQLIDETGTVFTIPQTDDDPLGRLGYEQADAVAVSSAWLQFLPAGPDLTVAAAGSSPTAPSPSTTDAPSDSPSDSPSATPQPTATPAVDAVLAATASTGAAAAAAACEPGTVEFTLEQPLALSVFQTEKVWRTATGAGITVAVVDSGIDIGNRHLADAVVGGVNLVGDGTDARGYTDLDGHGTSIAGEIAAQSIDESGVVGIAPDARLLSVRVFRGRDQGTIDAGFGPTPARIAAGIRWSVDNGAQIVNVSISDVADVPAVRDAVAYAAARGSLVVASAGNRNTTTDETDGARYPAANPGALAVAAADVNGVVTDASIHGPHVQVAALGSQVLTATTGGGDCIEGTEAPSTSFATGYVSAAAALVAQAHPDETPEQWAYRLMATAVRSNPDARDDRAGWGVIQPGAAIALLPDPDLRGPVSPFFDSAGAPLPPYDVDLELASGDSPFELTREMATLVAVGGAAVLAVFGVIGMLRLRRRGGTTADAAVVASTAAAATGSGGPLPRRRGLLDRTPDDVV